MADNLLNPPVIAAVCKQMQAALRVRLEREERRLTHTVLDQNTYLQVVGRAAALREALAEQETIYDRNFNI